MSVDDRFDQLQHAGNTRRTYHSRLGKLGAPPASLDAEAVRSWVREQTDGAPAGTALPTRAAAQHLLVAEHGMSPSEARDCMPKIGRDARARAVPTTAEMDAFYAHAESLPPGPVRDVLLLLPETGLRISEAVALRAEHVGTVGRRSYLTVKGKGDVARTVPLSARAADLLAPRIEAALGNGGYLFPSEPGATRPITADAVRVSLRRARTADPSVPALTPHQLRHWFATNAIRNGAHLVELQKVLGHASPETTAIYTHPGLSELFDLVDRGTRK